MTENISRSGVLFHTDTPVRAKTPVEMRLVLPFPAASNAAARIICHAQVVRVLERAGTATRPAMAVTISDYKFVPGSGTLGARALV